MVLPTERKFALMLTVLLWAAGSAAMIRDGLQAPNPDWVAICTTPLVWVVVISLPCLAHVALKERYWLATALLALAAVVGSAYTLNGTIARGSESRDVKVAVAEASNLPVEQKKAELERATQRLEDAQRYADDERLNGGCKQRCQDWELRAKEVQARIDQLRTDLKSSPEKPAASGETRIAAFISWLPGVKASAPEIAQVVATVSPSLFGLTVEIAALALGFFAWRPSRTETVSRPRREAPGPAIVSDDEQAVIAALKRAGKPVTNDQLARLMRVSKSESSKRVAALNGRVAKTRGSDGREVQISLLN